MYCNYYMYVSHSRQEHVLYCVICMKRHYLGNSSPSVGYLTLGARGFLREELQSAISEEVKREKIDKRQENL